MMIDLNIVEVVIVSVMVAITFCEINITSTIMGVPARFSFQS